jgi:hypothetical protein
MTERRPPYALRADGVDAQSPLLIVVILIDALSHSVTTV